jgi:hypothetical protein
MPPAVKSEMVTQPRSSSAPRIFQRSLAALFGTESQRELPLVLVAVLHG